MAYTNFRKAEWVLSKQGRQECGNYERKPSTNKKNIARGIFFFNECSRHILAIAQGGKPNQNSSSLIDKYLIVTERFGMPHHTIAQKEQKFELKEIYCCINASIQLFKSMRA